jgi:excisionase family DNA binding protein
VETKWLTVNEAAKVSGYHPEYVRQLVREGKVNAKKFSIVWMVDKDSLLTYVKNQDKPTQDQRPKV